MAWALFFVIIIKVKVKVVNWGSSFNEYILAAFAKKNYTLAVSLT